MLMKKTGWNHDPPVRGAQLGDALSRVTLPATSAVSWSDSGLLLA
jgi:hypothetical protein